MPNRKKNKLMMYTVGGNNYNPFETQEVFNSLPNKIKGGIN